MKNEFTYDLFKREVERRAVMVTQKFMDRSVEPDNKVFA